MGPKKPLNHSPKLLPNRRHVILSQSDNLPSEVIVYHQIQDLLEKRTRWLYHWWWEDIYTIIRLCK